MDDQDRIKLAEAMGWTRGKIRAFGLLNPEHDANDDYEVLLYARKEWRGETTGCLWKDRSKWIPFKRSIELGHKYQIGDYARAALKELEN